MNTRNILIVCGLSVVAAGCRTQQKSPVYGYTESGSVPVYSSNPTYSTSRASTYATSSESFKNPSTAIQEATDVAVTTQFKQAMNADPALANVAPNITVKSDNGTMSLSGTVASEQDKQRLETLAQSTAGVSKVDNQLQVSPAPAAITGQSSRIYSNTTDQVIGDASNKPADDNLSPTSDRSTKRIYSTPTPPATDNSSAVQSGDMFKVNAPGGSAADQATARQISQALKTDTSFAALASSIAISLNNGVATMTGTVPSEDEKNNLETAIKRISSVTGVDNQLQVSSNIEKKLDQDK